MRKCPVVFLAIVVLAIVPAFFCLAQQKAPAVKPAGVSTGKEYISRKIAPGAWHIEDTVHATYILDCQDWYQGWDKNIPK